MAEVEDKLDPEQRIRLESLAQAVLSLGAHTGRSVGDDAILNRAAKFERFIRQGHSPACEHRPAGTYARECQGCAA